MHVRTMSRRIALAAGGLTLAAAPGPFQALRDALRAISRGVIPSASIQPGGIIVHHSATGPDQLCHATAAAFEEEHKLRGMAVWYRGRIHHIAYHYVILPDGTIEPGRPELCRGAHTKSSRFNRWLGICVVGYFDPRWADKKYHRPTPKQMQALANLTGELMQKYRFDATKILPHRAVNVTECPGKSFPLSEYLSLARTPSSPVSRPQASSLKPQASRQAG
ncbi:MAG TPA: peptidoglycan recognition family protein [bacterium]|nr:peptidoglycan recognition family protein [bacterium]